MPKAGDTFVVELKPSHLGWGIYRYTDTRDPIYGEGYIPIPRRYAKKYDIFNSNDYTANTRYYCSSSDSFYNGVLLAQGCSTAGDVYAKQFAEEGNLKGIGSWYASVKSQVGDHVRVTWVAPDVIKIEHFQQIIGGCGND